MSTFLHLLMDGMIPMLAPGRPHRVGCLALTVPSAGFPPLDGTRAADPYYSPLSTASDIGAKVASLMNVTGKQISVADLPETADPMPVSVDLILSDPELARSHSDGPQSGYECSSNQVFKHSIFQTSGLRIQCSVQLLTVCPISRNPLSVGDCS